MVTLFVWATRHPQSMLGRWANPRPGRDNPRMEEHIEKLSSNCFMVQGTTRTLSHLRNLMLKNPESLLILRVSGDPLKDGDLLDELNKLSGASKDAS